MKQATFWDRIVDLIDLILQRVGLIRYSQHELAMVFYRDWLKDISDNEPISQAEKKQIAGIGDG